jgi:hypothetical protein
MSDPHDHEPGAFDQQLGRSPVHVEAGNPSIEVTVTVPVDSATLTALTKRAEREGRDVEALIAEALHAAA